MHSEAEDSNTISVRARATDAEFRAAVIYFIVVDRFHDGEPNNNTIGNPELYDPERKHWQKYWGGDVQGVIEKLDYLSGMGISAMWLTPLFEQVELLVQDRAAMHGYWPRDFKRLNPRWIEPDEDTSVYASEPNTYDRLLEHAHARGIKVILDVLCNHSSGESGGKKGQLFDAGKLIADFNDDEAQWYHHNGQVRDWSDQWQVHHCEFKGLAKFNQNNPDFRAYIKEAIRAWIKRGVDALRVDTVKHMPLWFWQEFTSDLSSERPDLFVFGEWIHSHPDNELCIEFANRSGMTLLDFGLCSAIRKALGTRDAAGFKEVVAIFDQDYRYRTATELVTFFENHDMPRLQSLGADASMLRLALVLVLTARGIPCLYYGVEQCLHDDTDGGEDPYNRPMMQTFDANAPLYQLIRTLAEVRKTNQAVQYGGQWTQYVNADVYCYTRRYRDARCFVALNRASETTLPHVRTDLPDGEYTCVISGRSVHVSDGQLWDLHLGQGEAIVLMLAGTPVSGQVVVTLQVNGCVVEPGQYVGVIGDVTELGNWNQNTPLRLEYINESTWQGTVVFDASAGKQVSYKYAIFTEGQTEVPQRENRTSRRREIPKAGFAKWRDLWQD